MNEMTVRDLIEFLKTQPQDLPVVYRCHSERVLLRPGDIDIVEAALPRKDGWVADRRGKNKSQLYLELPGN